MQAKSFRMHPKAVICWCVFSPLQTQHTETKILCGIRKQSEQDVFDVLNQYYRGSRNSENLIRTEFANYVLFFLL